MSKSANHKLKEAVAKAYSEGWSAGADYGNLPYKYPSHRVAWLCSDTRAKYYPDRTAEQGAEVLAWEHASYDGREEIASTPEDEGAEL